MHQIRRAATGAGGSASEAGAGFGQGPRQVRWATQLTRETRSLRVLRMLQDEIVSGRWPQGSQIPVEAELTAWLAVSRSTVREAVSTLVHLGMLEPRPSQGTFVRERSALPAALSEFTVHYDLEQLRPLLRSLEAEICIAAAADPSQAELDQLGDLERRGRDGERAAVRDFHGLLAAMAGNPLLSDLRAGLEGRLRFSGAVREPACAAGHRAILDAVAAGDPAAARAASERHTELRVPPADPVLSGQSPDASRSSADRNASASAS
ncbi:MAG: GntR family transcriptional regulator [Micropruina sp.]|uniref:FadR/GntR family transcriptional regulator n=1 Tax=Micropruina sp. TaxID=2737536 RepID=UPI0039E21FE7